MSTITNPGQAQFGIVQGSVYPRASRRERAETVAIGFEAYAIGGLSVGEPTDVMYDVVSQTTPLLPASRPRYLMGAGTPEDLVESVARGIDSSTACCRRETRATASSSRAQGRINIKNARYAEDDAAARCRRARCYTCRTCSRAYLRHLFLAGEINAATLNTLHNLQLLP